MSMGSFVYIGVTDGSSCHTQNSALAAWVIYTPTGQVLSSGGICLRPSSNNVAEYNAFIELLHEAISHDVHSLEVRLDSELVVSQLNGLYHVRDPTLLRRFLRGPYVVKHVLENGAYELVDYKGMTLVQPRNGLCLKKYYA